MNNTNCSVENSTAFAMDDGSNVTTIATAREEDIMPKVMNITLMKVGIATIILNIFVIVLIASYKWMRSNANVIICSMALTDLMAGVITTIAGAVKWTDWFKVQGLFCDVIYMLDVWAAGASLMHVLVVNLEHYFAIVFPLRHKDWVSVSRIRIALMGLWILTFAEGIRQAIGNTQGPQCILGAAAYPALAFGITMNSIFVPFVCVIGIYAHIGIVLVKKLKFMAQNMANLDQAMLDRSQHKMFGTVSAILAAWIVCWLPLMCVILVIHGAQTFGLELDIGQFVEMFYYVEIMSYGNSLLNPVLYFLLSPDFRRAVRHLVKCRPRVDPLSTGTGTGARTGASTSTSQL